MVADLSSSIGRQRGGSYFDVGRDAEVGWNIDQWEYNNRLASRLCRQLRASLCATRARYRVQVESSEVKSGNRIVSICIVWFASIGRGARRGVVVENAGVVDPFQLSRCGRRL